MFFCTVFIFSYRSIAPMIYYFLLANLVFSVIFFMFVFSAAVRCLLFCFTFFLMKPKIVLDELETID